MNEAQAVPAMLPVLPEMVLAVGAMALLMFGVFRGERAASIVNWVAIALLVLVAMMVALLPQGRLTSFGGSFVLDDFARFMKVLALAGSAFAIMMLVGHVESQRQRRFEYAVLILLSTLGMMVLVSATDLIALYLGLELMSLCLYVLAAIQRDSVRSTEAGLKYFVLGALSSGMLLYGASLIYGFTGTVSFAGIAKASTQADLGLVFGLVFLFAGFCFKVSAVPFHMLTLGAFAAIGQRNFKRLMAYSSIGHMGFALIGLAAGTEEGVRGVIIYMAIYLAMTLGTFACILAMRYKDGSVEDLADLSGLARTHPGMALFLALLLFSLAGVPPLAGFFAKFYVFLAAIKAGLYALAVIGVLASVVGAYYYLMIVKTMYFDEPKGSFEPMARELKLVLGVTGLFNLLFFAYPAPLIEAADAAAKSLF